MDNCYSVPELFKLQKTQYTILAHGAFHTNRRGGMNLPYAMEGVYLKFILMRLMEYFLASGETTW